MENWLKISDELYMRRVDSSLGARVYTLKKTGKYDLRKIKHEKTVSRDSGAYNPTLGNRTEFKKSDTTWREVSAIGTEPLYGEVIIEYEWELRGVLISDETTILIIKGKDEDVFRLVNSKIDEMTKVVYF